MSEHEHKWESRQCKMPDCESHYMCECGALSGRAKIQIEQLKYRAGRLEEMKLQKQADHIKEHLKIWLGNAFT